MNQTKLKLIETLRDKARHNGNKSLAAMLNNTIVREGNRRAEEVRVERNKQLETNMKNVQNEPTFSPTVSAPPFSTNEFNDPNFRRIVNEFMGQENINKLNEGANRIGMDVGGIAQAEEVASQEEQNVPTMDRPAVYVGNPEEEISDAEKVADDVPVDVPEGAFVINSGAVDEAGIEDLIKKVKNAYEVAEREGIDIKEENGTISKEDTVKLLVSKGELIISPQIARIIGYETLEKINNRGKPEVDRRKAEAEQQKERMVTFSGGFISKSART